MESNFATVLIVLIVAVAVVNIVKAVMAYLSVIKLEKRKNQILAEIMASEDAEVIGRAILAIMGVEPVTPEPEQPAEE